MEYLYALIATLVGAFFYVNSKKNSAEALLNNQKTKEEVLKDDRNIAKNDGLLDAEEQKRKELENAKKDTTDPADFFNRR